MAGMINRNGIYYVEFYDATRKPKARRLSLRTRKKGEARKRHTELTNDYEAGRFDPWYDDPRTYKQERQQTTPSTLREALDAFLAEKESEGRATATIKNYGFFCGALIDTIGENKSMRHVTTGAVEAYVRDESVSQATRGTRFRHVRAWLRWCEKKGYVPKAVTEDMTPPSAPDKMPKAIRVEDMKAIEATMRAHYAEKLEEGQLDEGEVVWMVPMLWFGLYSGLRAGELARLRWGHIDLERSLIRIYEQKNGKQQTVPLTTPARRIVEGLTPDDPEAFVFLAPGTDRYKRSVDSFKWNLARKFKRYREAAGIERQLSPHGLRHGFCTILAEAGKSAPIIKEAARHSDVSTSMRYVHIANEKLKSELDDVFA